MDPDQLVSEEILFNFEISGLGSFLAFVKHFWSSRPNKRISMFRVTGQKILARVGTYNFFLLFFFFLFHQ